MISSRAQTLRRQETSFSVDTDVTSDGHEGLVSGPKSDAPLPAPAARPVGQRFAPIEENPLRCPESLDEAYVSAIP